MTQIHWLNQISADFNTAADWSAGAVPGASDNAILDAAGKTHYTVAASTSETVNSLQLARTAVLAITGGAFTANNGTGGGANAGTIAVDDGAVFAVGGARTFNNTGAITLNSAGGATEVKFEGNAALSGGGNITLSDNAANTITGAAAGAFLTNVDNTITGAGSLGAGQLTLRNQAAGVIDASGTNALILNTGAGGAANAGLIEATGTGGLLISGTNVNGTGGTILAGAGSSVTLQASTVTGGTLSTEVAGRIIIADGSSVVTGGEIANAGTIVLESTGMTIRLTLDANTTLTGGGTISLSANRENAIKGANETLVLTNVDNTIVGSGGLRGRKMTLVNDAAGVIDADSKVALIVRTGNNTITNAGLIEATGSGKGTILSPVANTGTLEVAGKSLTFEGEVTGAGSAVVNAGILVFDSSFNENVAFTGETGKLKLAQSQAYAGQVSGFSQAGLTSLHLGDIAFLSSAEATFSGTATSGVLTVTDGIHTAHITLIGDYTGSTFVTSSDHHGSAIVVAFNTPSAPSAHRFIAASAALGGSAGEAIHAGAAWTDHTPMLVRPRAVIA